MKHFMILGNLKIIKVNAKIINGFSNNLIITIKTHEVMNEIRTKIYLIRIFRLNEYE